jgi:Flp pilus assembly protein TadD
MKRFLLILCLANSALAGPEEVLREANELRQQRQWKEAVALMQKQDLASWPDARRLEALQIKAQMESFAKMGAEAEATIRQAIALQPQNPDWWILLGDNYVNNFTDKSAEAMHAYREALKLSGNSAGWQRFTAALALARMLTDEVKPEEALALLGPVDEMPNVPPVWRIKIIRGRAHALASAGRDAEALAQFRAALALENETTKPAAK